MGVKIPHLLKWSVSAAVLIALGGAFTYWKTRKKRDSNNKSMKDMARDTESSSSTKPTPDSNIEEVNEQILPPVAKTVSHKNNVNQDSVRNKISFTKDSQEFNKNDKNDSFSNRDEHFNKKMSSTKESIKNKDNLNNCHSSIDSHSINNIQINNLLKNKNSEASFEITNSKDKDSSLNSALNDLKINHEKSIIESSNLSIEYSKISVPIASNKKTIKDLDSLNFLLKPCDSTTQEIIISQENNGSLEDIGNNNNNNNDTIYKYNKKNNEGNEVILSNNFVNEISPAENISKLGVNPNESNTHNNEKLEVQEELIVKSTVPSYISHCCEGDEQRNSKELSNKKSIPSQQSLIIPIPPTPKGESNDLLKTSDITEQSEKPNCEKFPQVSSTKNKYQTTPPTNKQIQVDSIMQRQNEATLCAPSDNDGGEASMNLGVRNNGFPRNHPNDLNPVELENEQLEQNILPPLTTYSSTDPGMPHHYQFLLPQDLVGRFIGKKGFFMKQIKNETKVHIILEDSFDSPKFKLISLLGDPFSIDKATKMIEDRFPQSHYPSLRLQSLQEIYQPVLPITSQIELVEQISNDCIISQISGCNHFFLQQPCHPTYPALSQLVECMSAIYNTQSAPPLCVWTIGTICAIPIYSKWYRAAIIDINEDLIITRNLDFGGYCTFNKSCIRQMRVDFLTLPFQAIEVILGGIESIDPEGSFDERKIIELTSNQILSTKILNYTEQFVPIVEMIATKNKKSVCINELLVKMGLAKWNVSIDNQENS